MPLIAMAATVTCCPDVQSERCHTVQEWRSVANCTNFPSPEEGVACPSAEAVAKSCDSEVGPSRVDGDKCCYMMPVGCQ